MEVPDNSLLDVDILQSAKAFRAREMSMVDMGILTRCGVCGKTSRFLLKVSGHNHLECVCVCCARSAFLKSYTDAQSPESRADMVVTGHNTFSYLAQLKCPLCSPEVQGRLLYPYFVYDERASFTSLVILALD
eukprot:jgi/Mesvir1/24125/Mv10842-RA.1